METDDGALEAGVAQELRTDLKMERLKLHGSQSCVMMLFPAAKESKGQAGLLGLPHRRANAHTQSNAMYVKGISKRKLKRQTSSVLMLPRAPY